MNKVYEVKITINEARERLLLVLDTEVVGDPDKWDIVSNIGEHLRSLENEGESFS